MVTILMGLIAILLPVGSAFFILAFQALDTGNKSSSIVYLILGVVIWGSGVFVWRELRKAYNSEKQEESEKFEKQLNELKGIRSDIKDSFNKFSNEIAKNIGILVNEIRQERNERNKKQSRE
jgi:predicted negative regulator of RcsB-dependent stress response